jgi:serine/threonine-protein kinase RsbW
VTPQAASGLPGSVPLSRFLFRGRPEAVRRVIGAVMGVLSHVPLDGDARDSLQLVLAEVLNNTVEHACRDGPDQVIELTVSLADDVIRCEVIDDGLPMPGERLPQGSLPDPATLPEGGFGWFLTRRLTRHVDYRRDEGRNRVSFSIPLAGTPDA